MSVTIRCLILSIAIIVIKVFIVCFIMVYWSSSDFEWTKAITTKTICDRTSLFSTLVVFSFSLSKDDVFHNND